MTEQAVLESETKRAAELSASEEEKTAAIPLLYLIRQLLRNASHHTAGQLAAIASENVTEVRAHGGHGAHGVNGVPAGDGGHKVMEDRVTEVAGSRRLHSPSLQLLLRFQRLVVVELFGAAEVSGESEAERRTEGILALLRKYLSLICCHVLEILPTATDIGNR